MKIIKLTTPVVDTSRIAPYYVHSGGIDGHPVPLELWVDFARGCVEVRINIERELNPQFMRWQLPELISAAAMNKLITAILPYVRSGDVRSVNEIVLGVDEDDCDCHAVFFAREYFMQSARDEITADTTDTELSAIAVDFIAQAEGECVKIVDDTLTYLRGVRDGVQGKVNNHARLQTEKSKRQAV